MPLTGATVAAWAADRPNSAGPSAPEFTAPSRAAPTARAEPAATHCDLRFLCAPPRPIRKPSTSVPLLQLSTRPRPPARKTAAMAKLHLTRPLASETSKRSSHPPCLPYGAGPSTLATCEYCASPGGRPPEPPDVLALEGREYRASTGTEYARDVRVLVIGTGGREHAIVRALSMDPAVSELHAAPGNPGIAELATLHEVRAADPEDVARLATRLGADLVVIGPEAPLVAGVA